MSGSAPTPDTALTHPIPTPSGPPEHPRYLTTAGQTMTAQANPPAGMAGTGTPPLSWTTCPDPRTPPVPNAIPANRPTVRGICVVGLAVRARATTDAHDPGHGAELPVADRRHGRRTGRAFEAGRPPRYRVRSRSRSDGSVVGPWHCHNLMHVFDRGRLAQRSICGLTSDNDDHMT